MKTRTPIIEKLIPRNYLSMLTERELVGWYAQVEAAHWQHHRSIERARHLEEDYTDPFDANECHRYQVWLDAAKPYLPAWYQPGYRLDVERQINACFATVTDALNQTIEERRSNDVKFDPASPLGTRQKALEWARQQVFALYKVLVSGGV